LFEEIGVLYRGLVLGLMIAAPVGPIGLMCIRRTIQSGLIVGFITGMGAAFADAIFGAIAAFGVAAILDFISEYDIYIRIFGGLIILFGAYHTWHDKPKQAPAHPLSLVKKVIGLTREDMFMGSLKGFVSGFAITMTNPLTIFGVLAVVATFSDVQSRLETTTLVAGIFMGSALWWFLLSGGVSLLRGHFTETRVIMINRITGGLLAAIAVWAISSGIMHFIARNYP
jgi:threonine/homoserine/homoserine lactone efflux protein